MATLATTRDSLIAILMMSFFIVGCSSGSGDNLDANGQPITDVTDADTDADTGADAGTDTDTDADADVGAAPDVATPVVSTAFGTIQSDVFTPICAECHNATGASAGLRLDEAASFSAIVNVASTEVNTLLRIAPGDPDNSYLVQKIEGTAAVGGRMPLGGPPLPDETIEFIRQWVTDGALPDTQEALAFAPRVVSSSIDQDATLNQLPGSVIIVWSSPVNLASLSDATVSLQASGGDGTFSNGNEINIDVSVPDLDNPYVTTLITNGQVSVDDTYQLRIAGDGDNFVRAIDSRAIDGDGNGLAGGSFVLDFAVE